MLDAETTNHELVQAAAEPTDSVAWGELHARYHPALVRHGLRSGLTASEAEEVALQSLAKLSHRLSRSPLNWDATGLRAWLSETANRLIFEVHRNRRRDALSADAMRLIQRWLPAAFAPEGDAPAREKLESHLWSVCLARVRTAVPAFHWQVFEAYVLQGQKSREVARLFNTTDLNVRIIRMRLASRIRKEWASLSKQEMDLPE